MRTHRRCFIVGRRGCGCLCLPLFEHGRTYILNKTMQVSCLEIYITLTHIESFGIVAHELQILLELQERAILSLLEF